MNLTLKKLILDSFKGVSNKEYAVGHKTSVRGQNRLGKTTLATSWYWLLSDKDYDLTSNPNIRPIGIAECTPTVTAVIDIDGKEVTISKSQKCKKGKPDENGVSKVALSNVYEINSVPKTERDFKAYLEDLGVLFERFLSCSHPKYFLSLKQEDKRKMLFGMTEEHTDYDIAVMSDETKAVADMLRDYTMEEISAKEKASRKKSIEQVEAIPNQIIGLEKAKIDGDIAEYEVAKTYLEKEIADITAKISSKSDVLQDLQSNKLELQFEINAIKTRINDAHIMQKRNLENDLYETESNNRKICSEIDQLNISICGMKTQINDLETKRRELVDLWKAENEKQYVQPGHIVWNEEDWILDDSQKFCSRCGQTLPESEIVNLVANLAERKVIAREQYEIALKEDKRTFDNFKKCELDRISNLGVTYKERIDGLKQLIAESTEKVESLTAKQQETEILKTGLAEKITKIQATPNYEDCEELLLLLKKDSELDKQIAELPNVDNSALEQELEAYRIELDSVKDKLSQFANNIRIDEQISELQTKQLDYEQAKADTEKILYQLDLVSKKKNELLTKEINSKFGNGVEWKLYEYQKNGEYKDVCIAMIDGKEYGISTNTGREIQAELEICYSFQKHFNMYVPVFLDGAESLNEQYLPISENTQLITLSVSEDSELKVEVNK